jgi:FAD/FMN-containing dehydrogenase
MICRAKYGSYCRSCKTKTDQAALLRGKLGAEKVLAHGKEPSDMGTYGTGFYWMEQAAKVVPICRVLPTSTADIVKVLEVSHETQCPFAVKSGGCATYAEAANIEGGITIDLSRFKEITISQDRKTVMVSTGCRWGEVYSKLDKVGLAIVGGRISSVGVGGLTLGGRRIPSLRLFVR